MPQLRPLGVGELLDVALKIWRRHFGVLARVVLFVVAPFEILSSLIITSVTPDAETVFAPDFGQTTNTTLDFFTDTSDAGDAATVAAGLLVASLLSGFAFLISSASALRAVSVAYLGGTPDWRESLQLALRRIGSLVWLAVLMGLGLMAGFVALFVPGVWLSVAWSLAFVALLAEGIGGTRALGRSFSLVRGRWWPTFGTLLVAFILQAIVDQIASIPFSVGALVSDSGSFAAFVSLSLSSIVSAVITTPFVAAVLVLVYFDLRVRKEGFDLELLAQGMGEATGWAPPAAPPGAGWPPPAAPPPPPSDWPPPGSTP